MHKCLFSSDVFLTVADIIFKALYSSEELQWVLSVLHQFFAFKKFIAHLVFCYSSRFSFVLASIHSTRVHVSLRYDENKQSLYIQREPHSFIKIGSLLPLLPMTHNCTASLEKSESSLTVF